MKRTTIYWIESPSGLKQYFRKAANGKIGLEAGVLTEEEYLTFQALAARLGFKTGKL